MITQSMIIELREKTGAGVMNCRNTLNETNGDMEKAIALLKEKGLAIAAKKAERITAEGVVEIFVATDHKAGALIEVNCETDFVAVNKDFLALSGNLAKQAATTSSSSIAEFVAEKYIADEGMTVNDEVTSLIAKVRENITVRRFRSFVTKSGFVQGYLHGGGRIGVLVELGCETDNPMVLSSTGKEIAMQIAAANPLFIDRNDVDPELLEKERQTYKSEAIKDGKSEAIVDKIVTGKIGKYLKEKCLVEQLWIKNDELTIGDYLQEESQKLNASIKIIRFVRFERGEGLEKKNTNLAEEVRNQMQGK